MTDNSENAQLPSNERAELVNQLRYHANTGIIHPTRALLLAAADAIDQQHGNETLPNARLSVPQRLDKLIKNIQTGTGVPGYGLGFLLELQAYIRGSPETSASYELQQLRRIDQTARAWYDSRSSQALDDLAEALFDGRPQQVPSNYYRMLADEFIRAKNINSVNWHLAIRLFADSLDRRDAHETCEGLVCENAKEGDAEHMQPLDAAICLGCWNKLVAEVIELRPKMTAQKAKVVRQCTCAKDNHGIDCAHSGCCGQCEGE